MARFLGSWRITALEQWDREYMDLVAPAFISFAARGSGEFQFGAVHGSLDCRFEDRDGVPRVEFSWEGDSEGDPACGRGWVEVHAGGTLKGRLDSRAGAWRCPARDNGSIRRGRTGTPGELPARRARP